MKTENPYFKVLSKKYLSLIVAPIILLGGIALYAHIQGISRSMEYTEGLEIFLFIGLPLYIGIHVIMLLAKLLDKNFPEAFGLVVCLVLILAITRGDFRYCIPYFTQKIENFAQEKQYYLRRIEISPYIKLDGKGKLVDFELTAREGDMSCGIIYDESDTLLDPINDHRWLSFSGTLGHEKTGDIPIKIIKIEPTFYYVCRDFAHIKKIKD